MDDNSNAAVNSMARVEKAVAAQANVERAANRFANLNTALQAYAEIDRATRRMTNVYADVFKMYSDFGKKHSALFSGVMSQWFDTERRIGSLFSNVASLSFGVNHKLFDSINLPLRFSLNTHNALSSTLSKTWDEVANISFASNNQILDLAAMESNLIRLDSAWQLVSDNVTFPASAEIINELKADIGAVKSLAAAKEKLPNKQEVRDLLFANWDSAEYEQEKDAITNEINEIDGFAELTAVERIESLLRISALQKVESSGNDFGGRVSALCVGLAINIMSAEMGLQARFLAFIFAFITLSLNLFGSFRKGISNAKQRLEAMEIPTHNKRVVKWSCMVYSSHKHSRRRMRMVGRSTVLDLIEKRGEWVCVSLIGSNEVLGWVQSKYLAKL